MTKILTILLVLTLLTPSVVSTESVMTTPQIEAAINDRTRGILAADYVKRLASAITAAATKHSVDPLMITAIIMVESGFNQHADSKYGSGLMQVVYGYHRSKVKNRKALFDVETNIGVGSQILASCRDRSKTPQSMLRCYNGGGDPRYVTKVFNEMNKMTTVREL